jgi:hypothetical protein
MDVSDRLVRKTYDYNNTLSVPTGSYKIYLKYDGGKASPVIIDDMHLSANLLYPGGCNISPTAADDFISGAPDRTASGDITSNDMDPDGETLSSYLITSSEDGTVNLAMDGHFTFTPKPGFSGTQTSFIYQACDAGNNPLCSPEARVTIYFPPASSAPLSITDVQTVTKIKAVDVKWIASSDAGIDRFEIERSTDGEKFEKAGTVISKSGQPKEQYMFTDHLTDKTMKNNDLFYRIRQVNQDGEMHTTKTSIVRVFQTKTLQSVTVSPHSTVNDIRVNFQLNENAFILMKLTSSAGEEIKRRSIKSLKGINAYTLEGTGNIRQGMYVLEVIVNSNERMVVKLIKS